MNPMINVDGVITQMADATVPVMDRGFLYGDSVYEVFRTYKGVPVFMDDHFKRLENSAALISMTISQSREELIQEIRRTVKASSANSKEDIYVRYQITRGIGPVDLYPDPGLETRYVPNIKGGNYLNNILAITQARQLGADDCIILNREGLVTEAANSNVWFVINGQLTTPATGNLKGLTKMHIHRALKGAGISSQEADIHANELCDATECFVTSATRDVMPCASLRLEDGEVLQFPEGGGEITRQVQAVFLAYLDTYASTHATDALV